MNNTLPLADFETAKRLKKLGFDYPVNNFFRDKMPCLSFTKINFNDFADEMSHPEIALVFQWLREEKGIDVCPMVMPYNAYQYFFQIYEKKKKIFYSDGYDAYSQAEQSALSKALDILEGFETKTLDYPFTKFCNNSNIYIPKV